MNYTEHERAAYMAGDYKTADAYAKLQALQEAVQHLADALDDLCAWGDGDVGGHMDEPYAAEVARKALYRLHEVLK